MPTDCPSHTGQEPRGRARIARSFAHNVRFIDRLAERIGAVECSEREPLNLRDSSIEAASSRVVCSSRGCVVKTECRVVAKVRASGSLADGIVKIPVELDIAREWRAAIQSVRKVVPVLITSEGAYRRIILLPLCGMTVGPFVLSAPTTRALGGPPDRTRDCPSRCGAVGPCHIFIQRIAAGGVAFESVAEQDRGRCRRRKDQNDRHAQR